MVRSIAFRTMLLLVALLGSVSAARAATPGAAGPELSATDLPEIPPTEPAQALSTFRVRPGFELELVAAEPLVTDPIALSFDEHGRLFVVEMRDYSERRHEQLGRIRLLEDTDADGRFDKSTVFADQLPWPTAVICYGGGIFVGATPDILFLKDSNNDGVADIKEVIFTGFAAGVERLNVQQLLNSFNWGLDNRIHGATAANSGRITSPKNPSAPALDLRGRDFSFDPRTLEIRAETGGGQHGMSFDDRGRKFVCSNSAHLQMVLYEERVAGLNPLFAMPSPLVNIAADGPAAEVFRISPDEPWRVIRTKWRVAGLVSGPIEGGGRPSGYFTAATGVTIYRGDAFAEEFRGNAFIADCGSNLIHRKQLVPNGVALTGRRSSDELKSEFIACTDNWFRPVQFANAPDGTLYIADMYREVIEHPWSLPESIKKHLDLNSGNDRGRIYRVVPNGFKQPARPELHSATTAQLVSLLEHRNGWIRDAAARLLYEHQDRSAISGLERLLRNSTRPYARLHALHSLQSFDALDWKLLVHALSDTDGAVREHAVAMAPTKLASSHEELKKRLFACATDLEPRVRYRVALALGQIDDPARTSALSAIAIHDLDDPWTRAAVLNAVAKGAGELLLSLISHSEPAAPSSKKLSSSSNGPSFIRELTRMATVKANATDLVRLLNSLEKIAHPNLAFAVAGVISENRARTAVVLPPEAETVLKKLSREAVTVAQNPQAAEADRLAAVQLIASTEPDSERILFGLLKPDQPNSIQVAAISEILKSSNSNAISRLVATWVELTPRSRAELLATLLSRTDRISHLLTALENNLITRSELTPGQITQLRNHRDAAIQRRAAQLFSIANGSSREKTLNQFETAISLIGDAARGHKIFTERCISCHRLSEEGFSVGPDLSSAKASGKDKLLINILDPNREVPPNFVNFLVETKDGESWTGLIANETASAITLKQAFAQERTILRSNIRKVQTLSQSMMPEGLEASMTPQDMADLLDYIVK